VGSGVVAEAEHSWLPRPAVAGLRCPARL